MKLARIALLTVVFFGCEKAPTERQEVKKAKEASPSTGKQADAKKLPEIALRGYGKVSGTFRETPPKDASLLELVCEDEAKAKLTQAKYLSDLVELPGVQATTVKTRQGPLNAWTAETQGLVAAIQIGNKVTIVAGKDEAALNRALAGSQADVAKRSSKAQVEVPMWLDRWDKFGFRFYYRA